MFSHVPEKGRALIIQDQWMEDAWEFTAHLPLNKQQGQLCLYPISNVLIQTVFVMGECLKFYAFRQDEYPKIHAFWQAHFDTWNGIAGTKSISGGLWNNIYFFSLKFVVDMSCCKLQIWYLETICFFFTEWFGDSKETLSE